EALARHLAVAFVAARPGRDDEEQEIRRELPREAQRPSDAVVDRHSLTKLGESLGDEASRLASVVSEDMEPHIDVLHARERVEDVLGSSIARKRSRVDDVERIARQLRRGRKVPPVEIVDAVQENMRAVGEVRRALSE